MSTTRAARRSLVAASILLSLACVTPALAEVTPQYFALQPGHTAGVGIGAAADGSVWFAANAPGSGSNPTPGIGRLIPSQASPGTSAGVSLFPTPTFVGSPCCANQVRGVAVDRTRNRVWFSQSDGIVGYADPGAVNPGASAGMIAAQVPGFPDLWDLAVAPSGLAWFTEESASSVAPTYYGDRIASIDDALGVHELENLALQGHPPPLDAQRYDAKPEGITTDSTGKPWFAEADPGYPGYRLATTPELGGAYSEYLITPCQPTGPCSGTYTGTGPADVAVAPDGSVWFTNQLNNEVGRLDVGASTFTSYSLPAIDHTLANGQARAISLAPDGTLWVAELGGISYPAANAIIGIVPSQPTPTATVYKLGAGHAPLGVAPDTNGNVWFTLATDNQTGLIGRLAAVTGSGSASPPPPVAGGFSSGAPAPSATHALTPARVGVARVGAPQTSGGSVKVDQACVGPPADPCSLIFIISTHEYVSGFPGSHASAAKKQRKPKAIVLGRKAVTLHGGEHRKITVSLNAAGRKQLKRAGKLTVFFTATQAGASQGSAKLLKRVKLTLRAKR
ncbi:MAG TPA: hypothetical protein VLJ42_00125 [Solirubrobacteraceae bacterium]|nr:hypothetical protein [Solirubrobacteraceae bacterium]